MRGLRAILRIISAGAIILSALLSVALLVLWVRSYSIGHRFAYSASMPNDDARITRFISSNGGMFSLNEIRTRLSEFYGYPFSTGWEFESVGVGSAPASASPLQRLGFDYTNTVSSRLTYRSVGAPHWFLATLFAAAPVCWSLRRRRIPKGHCQTCGYDLRETPDRCPECGTTAEQT
jgi:hypothetical protein